LSTANPDKVSKAAPKNTLRKTRSTSSADDDSAATAPAGADTLYQQNIDGKDREHQLRYDVRFLVPASTEVDKTMATAKNVFTKAKEMDTSLVIYPWFCASKSSKVTEIRLIPEKMGAFKTYFHIKPIRESKAGSFICAYG
jgi:hypothetical protein